MRTCAEINLDAIAHNINQIKSLTNARIMAVVKADAYGHGAKETASFLARQGVYAFGVATAEEAIELRSCGISNPILILGVIFKEDYHSMIENGISLTVTSYDEALALSLAAQSLNKKVNIHIKLDTGMGRLGFVCAIDDEALADCIKSISELPFINIEGVFSHMSKSDEDDKEYSNIQYKKFMHVCALLEERGINKPIKHIANSAAAVSLAHTQLDMIRCGISLYGLKPSEVIDERYIDLRPAMTLKSRVSQIKTIEADSLISYGGRYMASAGQRIATISIGYADGFSRMLSGKAKVIINGKEANITGTICMDQCMADVTHIEDIKIGDEVIIFGSDGNNTISVDSVALLLGTINYEVVCSVARRVPRAYIQDNKIVSLC